MLALKKRERDSAKEIITVDCGRIRLIRVSMGYILQREQKRTFHRDFGRRTARCSLGRREAII